MKLEIKTLNNDVFYVECEENESIRDVKRKVADRDDLSEKYQMDLLKFLYAGKVMEDEEMIKTYEIKPDGYLVLIKQTPGKPPRVKRKPIPPFSLTNDLFSPNGFGGFNNPLLASPFSQDPFMQSTIKPHAASHHNAFNANHFNANSYGGYGTNYKPQGTAAGDSTDEFKVDSSLTTGSESLDGETELKTDTDLTLSEHSLGGADAFKPSSAMGGFPDAGAFGGMSGFKGGAGFAGGATGGFSQHGGLGGATGGFIKHAGLGGAGGVSQFGQGRSPFGRSNGAMVEKDIEQLMAMGFKRGVAKKALEQGCNHLEVALNMLLGGEIPDVGDDEDEARVDEPVKLPEIGKQTEKEKPDEKKEEAPLEVVIEQRRAKPRSLVRSPSPSPPRTPSPPLHSDLLSESDPSSAEKPDSLSEAYKFDGAGSFGGAGAFGRGQGMGGFGSFGGPGAFGGAGGFGGGGFGGMGGMGGFGRTGGFGGMGGAGGFGGMGGAGGFGGMGGAGGFGGMGGAGGFGGMGALGGAGGLGGMGGPGGTGGLGGMGALGGTGGLGDTGSLGGTDGSDDLPSLGHEGFSSSHGLGGGAGQRASQMKQLAQTLRQNPGQLQMIKHQFANQPEILHMIDNDPQQFINLLEQAGDRGGGFGGRQEIKVELTYLDREAITEIEGMGFEHDRVLEAYVLCDRNKEFTVNYLLSNASS